MGEHLATPGYEGKPATKRISRSVVGIRIDLFAVLGLEEARLDILSDDFLQRVAALEQENLALKTPRKLLSDQIRVTERSNLAQRRSFARRWKMQCRATPTRPLPPPTRSPT